MNLQKLIGLLWSWFDSRAAEAALANGASDRIDWARVIPFIAIHVGCFGVLSVGASPTALTIAIALFAVRMFAITAFYHRYFSHRAFRTSRPAQFLFAILGVLAVQRGPLWWASHHRHHHAVADRVADSHSSRQHGFLWSHTGWFLSEANLPTRLRLVPDLARYTELRWLDRFDVPVAVLFAVLLYVLGEILSDLTPELNTSGAQLLVWGFCISTVALYHATFTINSLAHQFGTRRYATRDDSRNNVWLAMLTFGEGWHNNHHHYPGAARQGFFWWEVDLTYYGLKLLASLGLIWDLRAIPREVRDARRSRAHEAEASL